MSECFEFGSSMTGSTNTGPPQPQKDSSPLPARSSPYDHRNKTTGNRGHRQRPTRKMTLTSANGQPIQLTPLWEHVVRTRKFPTEVDTRLTFLEISERLRDPEWEVRQHALRVLIDVLPTLDADVVDKVMQPVVPELVNNLGHPAPAVRKGALDAFRVFLIHCRDRESTIKNILQDGLNRSEVRDSFQTNVTTGVILSVPSLLFPSSSSPTPDQKLLKETTIALASRLAQVPHQEAVLKSLLKIRDAVGTERFENYLEDYDNKLKRNIEILSKIYHIRSDRRVRKRSSPDVKKAEDREDQGGKWESDSDTSGIAEEEEEVSNGAMPAGRVVLETEIKFNEETAITMTILEEKEDSDKDEESGTDVKNEVENKDSSPDRRKTPRRVHFGGEIVKLRTPDSDETDSVDATPKTRIPVPVSPATKMPDTHLRPSSQPCSPRREVRRPRRASRSVSNSPKREVYVHNAELSPKKSILARTSSPVLVNRIEQSKKKKNKLENREKIALVNGQGTELNIYNDNLRSFEVADRVQPQKEPQGCQEEEVGDKSVSKVKGQGDNKTKISSISNVEGFSKEPEDSVGRNKKNTLEIEEEKNSLQEKLDEENTQQENIKRADSAFGSVVTGKTIESNVDREMEDRAFGEDSRVDQDEIVDNGVVRSRVSPDSKNENVHRESLKNGERTSRSDKKMTSVTEKNSKTVRENEEVGSEEPSWEELGLVGQEVLEDLHNKDDWRARVRGLERVASALRTSSALIAIEPRLGSLLHAVLGCERSCRVAAAGLAVAKIVVAGVSEEALKERLPQLAWGLARQGGPSAAQLARIAMLRLRPALLLDQLLQPQCLNARNAKTRENTLQLLIFSLVTFPSTEFKVDTVAGKVAKMVRDRRRRVRQAALDTLAVLAQIYEPEEVLAAGKRASEGHHDGEAMMSAIRARLSRKSLPLVSADGLVMYGLQISPTVQIATGPDVDWIVAGNGSVSPGIGRTKGQIIATRSEKERFSRNENTSNYESPWVAKPNFVALGVGMRAKMDQPVVWQIMPQNQDIQCEDQLSLQATRSVNIRNGEGTSNFKQKNTTRLPVTTRESANYRNIVEENFERTEIGNKAESRIPVLFARERGSKAATQNQDKSTEVESSDVNPRRRVKDPGDNSSSDVNSQEENIRTYGTMYHRRKKAYQESNGNMCYDSYSSMKNSNNTSTDCNSSVESQEFSETSSRGYKRFMEKDRYSKKADRTKSNRSSSIENDQRSLPRNVLQQTFVLHGMYSGNPQRGRFVDENSFQPLQTGLTPPTQVYNNVDYDAKSKENNDRNNLSRARFHRRTKDAATQKLNEAELISSDGQTDEHFPAICNEAPYRRRLRSLSPSQLYHRQQFVRAPNEMHAISMYEIDKAMNEEEYNEKNKHHFLPEETYRVQSSNGIQTQFEADEQELSSSDTIENDCQSDIKQTILEPQNDSDSRPSTSERKDEDTAFNIISDQTSPPDRDTVDFVIALDENIETPEEPPIENNASKDSSSEGEEKSRHPSRVNSRNSERIQFEEENQNDNSECNSSDEAGRPISGRRSGSVSMTERVFGEELQESTEIARMEFEETVASPSRRFSSPKKSSRSSSRNSGEFETGKSPSRSSHGSPQKLSFEMENEESTESSEDRAVSPAINRETDSVTPVEMDQSRRESKTEPPAIIIASRPHSTEVPTRVENCVENYVENNVAQSTENENSHRFINESTVSNDLENDQSKDSSSETNTEPGILKIEPETVERVPVPRRMVSRVPRVTSRFRGNARHASTERGEKPKPIVQQCFTQLDSKDWEVTMKGLKTLSQIAKQQPEYLDVCATGTISRLLGRQIKSLRSQVARTACLAAGDIFSSQIRGIDQDFDDIAGPLLHRTADTNRFLRADSNAALDRMVEHLPPHRTIGIIVQRGASHQNAIVRAATARLLANIVDRIGPEHTMILPKDVRDKLLNTGARLLTDGNLDARNHSKKLFRRIMHCEGFRKALTDAVPDTTLRHIDKTLRTL